MYGQKTFCPLQYIKNNEPNKEYMVEMTGIEPATLCVQGRCSPN